MPTEEDTDPIARADDVELAFSILGSTNLETVLDEGCEAAESIKWAVAVLWMVSGAADQHKTAPKIFALLASRKGIVWSKVLDQIPAFVRDMEIRVEKQRKLCEYKHRPMTPLTDDELPF